MKTIERFRTGSGNAQPLIVQIDDFLVPDRIITDDIAGTIIGQRSTAMA